MALLELRSAFGAFFFGFFGSLTSSNGDLSPSAGVRGRLATSGHAP
jgi:hypothetical protein